VAPVLLRSFDRLLVSRRIGLFMHAEVIAIGDELTSGQRLDTNSQWLSQQLGDIGIRTMFHTTVADDLPANRMAFAAGAQRVDYIICTGGLGPTADDLTRQAIAESFGLGLDLDEDSLAHIREMFESRGREMPERNQVQAMFPHGSRPIPNPHGTAPGVDLVVNGERRCRIFALPGVPAEMKEMWTETVRPTLISELGENAKVVRHYRLKCFGTGESACEEMLPDLIRRGRNPTVGITVSKATITLRITGQAETDAEFQELIGPTAQTIRENLGQFIFGEEDEELQHAVAKLLLNRNETVAVCEMATGGLVAQWLSQLEGNFFAGGTVAGAIDPNEGAPARASRLALQAKEKTNATFGLSIGEFPSTTGVDEKVFIGLATNAGTTVTSRRFAGHPDILRERAAKQVLDVLRLHLLGG